MLELIMDVWGRGGGGGVRWSGVVWGGRLGENVLLSIPYSPASCLLAPITQPFLKIWQVTCSKGLHFYFCPASCLCIFVLLLASVRYLLPMIFTSIFHTSISVHPSPLRSKPAPLGFFSPYAWFVNRCSWINVKYSFLTFTGILRLGSAKNVLWKQHDF